MVFVDIVYKLSRNRILHLKTNLCFVFMKILLMNELENSQN